MSLTCGYSSPRSDGDANSQVTGARVQVPLGHEPFGHDAMLPALRLTGPRRADLNKLPNLRRLLTAELAAARRCRTAGSGAFSRRVWCCAEPARLGVNAAGLLRRRVFGACLAAVAGQSSRRVVRTGRLVRTAPDRPEGPRPSGPDPQPPVEPQARQEAICEQDEDKPIGVSENARRSGRLFCGEEERLSARRGRPATGSGESVIPAGTACALPGRRRAGGQVRCGPLLEDECGAQPGYLENLP